MSRFWTTLEESTLAAMWNRDDSLDAIANALNRSERSIQSYLFKNGKRIGAFPRRRRWTAAEDRLVVRELELAFTRIAAGAPGRLRGGVAQKMISYLLADNKRRHVKARAAKILDIGGMQNGGTLHEFGLARKPIKRKKAA